MKLTMVQTLFTMLPLLLLGLGLDLGLGLSVASEVREVGDLALSEFWSMDSQSKTEASEGQKSFREAESLVLSSLEGVMLPNWSEEIILSEDKVGRNGLHRAEALSQDKNEQHRENLLGRECNNLMAPKIKKPNRPCINNYTFIHEEPETVKAVCSSPTVPCVHRGGKCHKSSRPFDMTLCKLSKADQITPHCHYLTFIMKYFVIMTCNDQNIYIVSKK